MEVAPKFLIQLKRGYSLKTFLKFFNSSFEVRSWPNCCENLESVSFSTLPDSEDNSSSPSCSKLFNLKIRVPLVWNGYTISTTNYIYFPCHHYTCSHYPLDYVPYILRGIMTASLIMKSYFLKLFVAGPVVNSEKRGGFINRKWSLLLLMFSPSPTVMSIEEFELSFLVYTSPLLAITLEDIHCWACPFSEMALEECLFLIPVWFILVLSSFFIQTFVEMVS